MAFCPYCGGQLAESPTQQMAAPQPSESSVRLATVLFGDVKGFTAMSEDLPPEEVANIMNECFEALSQPIVKYEGTIDKYVGDALMARFGAPRAHEDDPVRAIHAALEMQRILTEFAARLKATRGFELAMRIGINTGQVLAGEVGSAALKQFTLMGNTVNLASRLEHAAEPGSVLVGETTYRLARHAFEFKAMPPMEIRGQKELINAFVPLRPRLGATSSRAERSERKLRLVGRQTELGLLDTYLAEARAGEGRLGALVGDPGVGKSRLVDEFWKRHLDQGVVRIYAAAPSFGESMPYSMLSAFIRSLLFGELTDHELTGEELRDKLASLLPASEVDDAVALLDDLLGIEGGEKTEVQRLEGKSRQAMLTRVLKVVLAVRSRQQPLLLNLEDMHWADRASLDVLDEILTGIQSLPVMVLVTHRPQFSPTWSGKAFFRQINLRELTEHDARELLAEFFGSNAIPEEVGTRVIEKAGGNPFFLEQLLNNLVESGSVLQQDGTWALAGDIGSLSVPDTIQEILLARIDQLSRGARTVLEVAAVIGRIFVYRLLKAVTDAERNLDEHLQTLKQQEFIFEKSILPELEYMFTHALTQDVAYHGLPEARRRVLHERVAQAIESLGITAPGEQLQLLAVHYEKTANREKALEYALAAGERSRRLYANQDAVTHFRQALALLEQEPGDNQDQKLMVLEVLGDVTELLAQFEEAYDYYARAREEASSASDRARLVRKLGGLAESRGRTGEALTLYREAEETVQEADDPVEQINVWLALARNERSRGALDSAFATCVRALSQARKADDAANASLYYELGEIERERGHTNGAENYLLEAERIWKDMESLEKQALVSSALADVAFNRGELAEALGYFQRALETQRRVLDREGMASTLSGIGRIRLAMGELDAAIDCYNEAMAIAGEIDSRLLTATCQLQLGTIYLDRGDVAQAQTLVDEAYQGFKRIRNWRGSARARLVRGRLFRARGDPDHARIVLQQAGNLAAEMNDLWLQAQVCISEAELEEEVGRLERAEERGTAGVGMARDLLDPRLVARGERIMGRIRARQGRRDEALRLLQVSTETLRRSGAQLDAARAALDYVVAAQGTSGNTMKLAHQLLDFALDTFERTGSARDLQIAQAVAERMGRQPVGGPFMGARSQQ